jgi:hypothetical protein
VNEVEITVGKCQTTSCVCLGITIKFEKRYLEISKLFQDAYKECSQIGWTEGRFLYKNVYYNDSASTAYLEHAIGLSSLENSSVLIPLMYELSN